MSKFFKHITLTFPERKPDYFDKKRQPIFTDIGGECYVKNLNKKLPPLKNNCLSKVQQEK